VDSIASISGRLAVLEDAMKIIKGEVKQVFTEIRAAILVTAVRDLLPGERSSPRQIKPITRDTGVGTLIRHMLLSRNYRRRLHARPTRQVRTCRPADAACRCACRRRGTPVAGIEGGGQSIKCRDNVIVMGISTSSPTEEEFA
jgi:hypothetical protein